MNRTHWLYGGVSSVMLAVAALGAGPQVAAAQTASGPGWSAWLGCWEPVPAEGAAVSAVTPYLCFLPGENASQVEVVSVEADEVSNRHTLDASGVAVAVTREECSGTELMQWSSDASRVYQRSTYDCPGGLQRQSTGIFSMTPTGEWLDVAAVSVGEATNVRVIRYRGAPEVEVRVEEIGQALADRAMTREMAMTAAMAPVDGADLIEALGHIEAPAVEGWLIESGQQFRLDRQRVVELADAGVPDGVIDVMVALSYPDVFAIDRAGRPEAVPGEAGGPAVGSMSMRDPWLSPYGYRGFYNGFYPGYYYSDYYYDPYYSRYGYGPGYGYDGYYGRGYNRPVIVVVQDGDESGSESNGRLVNGRGYTRGSGSGASEPRTSSSPSRSTRGSGSSDSDGSASSDGYSGGSNQGRSTGRTARPRDD